MQMMNRRHFAGAAAAALLLGRTDHWSEAQRRRYSRGQDRLRITRIESHQVYLPYHDFNATTLFRYHGGGIQARTIHVVSTNLGLVGYGENWGKLNLTGAKVKKYIGTSPFDWINDTANLEVNMAMYDLMGKYLEVPAWKMIGPRVRKRVPVAAWTVSQVPEALAREVEQAHSLGYHWLKYHCDEVQNVEDQVAAMEAVANPDFRLHLDLNMNAHLEDVLPLLKRLDERGIVGRLEDPVAAADPDNWNRLREELETPVVAHHAPRNFLVRGLCDGYMAGHSPIGHAVQTAAIAESMGLPIMLQQCGGQINQAFLAHEAAVFPAASMDHVNLARLWRDDITTTIAPIEQGSIAVPEGPGLGVEVDMEKLRHYAEVPAPAYEPFLVRIRYRQGPTIYCRHDPHQPGCTDNLRFLSRLLGEKFPGPPARYDNAVRTDLLDERDGAEFDRNWKATEKVRYVVQ
jgi:muconate cycloisomerase|tara:strand:- start:43 stop:1419 length:1377 start_codon:yes stop_codon:yes gene_type:complete